MCRARSSLQNSSQGRPAVVARLRIGSLVEADKAILLFVGASRPWFASQSHRWSLKMCSVSDCLKTTCNQSTAAQKCMDSRVSDLAHDLHLSLKQGAGRAVYKRTTVKRSLVHCATSSIDANQVLRRPTERSRPSRFFILIGARGRSHVCLILLRVKRAKGSFHAGNTQKKR